MLIKRLNTYSLNLLMKKYLNSRQLSLFCLLSVFALINPASLWAITYHVDAENGNDSSGDGSLSSPYRSLSAVRSLLMGGG